MTPRFFLLAVLIMAGSAAAQPTPSSQTSSRPPVLDVARAVQRNYDRVRDFSADFVHSYVGGVLAQQVTERGNVVIKKPGKMRWTYVSPEKKTFVSDGVKLYSYVPQDRQVTINAVPQADETSTPTLFLAGKGNLTRDFTISYADVPGAPPDSYALKLVPIRSEQDYDWLILVVDRSSSRIRMLVTTDTQGGRSTFTFSRMKENVNVPDKEFEFKIPRGVEVVDNSRL
jgi:outer membrane lipoprotein carrier protein